MIILQWVLVDQMHHSLKLLLSNSAIVYDTRMSVVK